MGIDQTGYDCSSLQIDGACLRTHEATNVRISPKRRDSAFANGERTADRRLSIRGQNLAVDEDGLDLLRSCRGCHERRSTEHDDEYFYLHNCLPACMRRRYYAAIVFQFFARWSAVRHASACAVRVGFRAPLVPITDAPRIPRFGTSCDRPHRFTTLVSGLSPMRVPP